MQLYVPGMSRPLHFLQAHTYDKPGFKTVLEGLLLILLLLPNLALIRVAVAVI